MQGFTQGFTKQSLTELWGAVYRILETQVVPSQMSAWLQHLEPVDTSTAPSGKLRLTVSAPNEFSANWVRSYYSRTIEDALIQITGASPELVVLAKGEILHYESREVTLAPQAAPAVSGHPVELARSSNEPHPLTPPAPLTESSSSPLSSVLPDYDMGPESPSDTAKLDPT
jgi:chromosomal replication initiation ATPase DnaA